MTSTSTETRRASRCHACGHVGYPAFATCKACGNTGPLDAVDLRAEGELYTFTVLHRVPPGFRPPYALGYADFEPGARLFARIDGTERPRVGMRVRLVDDPDEGYRFEPADSAEGPS